MQQLNVLSMKVSQSIENKDDSGVLISALPKDDFSQHIDLQLSKNKKSTESENITSNERTVSNDKVSSKMGKPIIEQQNIKTDDKSSDKSDYDPALVDDADPAMHMQEVAATDKKDEPDTNKVTTNDKKIIDESELLMSFLTKVDQTLVTKASSDKASPSVVNVGEMSDEQKAKIEAKLLLKSSELVADLSSVAKAVTSTADVSSDDIPKQEKVIDSLISSSKSADIVKGSNVKESIVDGQVSSKLSIDGESSTVEELVADKLVSKGSTNNLGSDLAEKNVVTNNKAIVQAGISPNGENKNAQKLVDTAIESQGTKQVETDNQSNKLQKNIVTTSKEANASNTSLPTKEILGTSTEVEPKINEKLEKLIKADNGLNALKNDVATAESDTAVDSAKNTSSIVKNNDNSTSQITNKNTTTTNLGQASVDPVIEETSEVESEGELSARSVDKLIEKNKTIDADGNKSVNDKANSTADIASSTNNSNFIGEARATQDTYDRIDQQSSEVLSLTGSAEVAQSQKTNTQLHQETISIFRRDFADAVKDKVMLIISQKLQQFDITLDPPELGNVQVRVNLQGEQATVNFVVQNQQAKEAFEQNMHKLRDLLADQGVDVGDANVEQQSQQSDTEGNTESNQSHFSQNTADASDAIEHNLSARMSDPSTKVIDYYA